MKYLYIDDGNILKAEGKYYHYEFDPSATGGISVDSNRKLFRIGSQGMRYNELLPKMYLKADDSEIKLEGKYELRNRACINDIFYYIRSSCTYDRFIFSCIISKDCVAPEYYISEDGEYIVVPENTSVKEYIKAINSLSPSIHVEVRPLEGLDDLLEPIVSNIVGFDLYNGTERKRITETEAYDKPAKLFLDEPMQISELIRVLRDEYPGIQFYNDANDRDNTQNTAEAVYYESSLVDDVSSLKGVVCYNDPVYGRVQMAEIPINFRYETPDLMTYINRRNEFLLNKLFVPIMTIFPKVNSKDRIGIGVSWNRQLDEERAESVADVSERQVYSFNVRCTLSGLLLEKSDEPAVIDDVLAFFYTKSQKAEPIEGRVLEISGIEEVVNEQEI